MSTSNTDFRSLIKTEYAKCAADPVYFMKNYCYIQHPIKGKLLFKLYPFQEDTLRQFRDNDLNIVLKCRQMGISTLVAGYALWMMLFKADSNILIIATKQDTAKNLVTKVREMQKALPVWLRGNCVEDNRLSMRFANGSQIRAEASSPEAVRGDAVSWIVIDECAHIDTAEEIWGGVASSISTGGSALLLSTPRGVGNFFHSKWVEAETGEKDVTGRSFNPIKLRWDLHPEYDQSWRDEQTKILGEQKASQECDCAFLTSGNTVVPSEILLEYQLQISDPIEICGLEHTYYKWKYPQSDKSYIVSADVARGDGADYSAFQVLEIESMEQVAEYKGKLDTTQFGDFLVSVATDWNNALLIVENAGIGWAVIQAIINRNYGNLFYGNEDLTIVDTHRKVNNRINSTERKSVPGFTTGPKSRPLVISKLDLYMRSKSVILHSKRLNEELFTFIWDNNKAQAMSGYNDDITMALAIGLWVRDTALRLRTESIASTAAAINGITRVATNTMPIMIANPHLAKNPWNMQVGHDAESLLWLL